MKHSEVAENVKELVEKLPPHNEYNKTQKIEFNFGRTVKRLGE